MRNFLIILLFPIICQGQTIAGQAIFTDAQRDVMNDRIDNQGLYVDIDSGGSGFHGDGDMIYYGAEQFRNNPVVRWTNMSTAVPILDYVTGTFEPRPQFVSGCPAEFDQTGECIEYIHYAAIISYVWNGRVDLITFNGVNKSKDAHAQDLAEDVWDVLVDYHNRSELDFGDTARWVRNSADGNPHFMSAAKVSKFLASYALVQSQLSSYGSYTTNVSSVETWFADFADFAYERAKQRADAQFGGSWQSFGANSFNSTTVLDGAGNDQGYTHYNSGGTATGYQLTNAQASGINNRWLDFVDYVSNYAAHFNNSTYKDFSFNCFRLVLAVGVFSDGTYNEWYRSYDTDPTQGFNYAILSLSKLVYMAHQHAVGVENGLAGMSDIGKYYDHQETLGTGFLYSSYPGSSTDGTKSLKLALENLSQYYRQSSNGGFLDVRYAEGGNSMDVTSEYRPYTVHVAIANSYYNDNDLEEFWNLNTSFGYDGMSWDNGGINQSARNAGPYWEHSIGASWGMSGSIYGGYFGQGDMENITFSGTSSTPATSNSILPSRRRNF